MTNIKKIISDLGIVAELRASDPLKVISMANVIYQSGVPCILVDSEKTANVIVEKCPEMIVGLKSDSKEEIETKDIYVLNIEDTEEPDTVMAKCHEAVCSVFGFELKHIGINCVDENAAESSALTFGLFGMQKKTGSSSTFAGTQIEFMHTMYRGENGHLGFAVKDVSKAVNYLSYFGFNGVISTAKYDLEDNLKMIYIEPEIAGFAVHLMKSN